MRALLGGSLTQEQKEEKEWKKRYLSPARTVEYRSNSAIAKGQSRPDSRAEVDDNTGEKKRELNEESQMVFDASAGLALLH